jgi:chromosome segregation protein
MKANDLVPYQQGRILGLLADIINVDPKYELSVEVVLGDKLQYVITESHEDAKEAVAYLKNKGKGRSSFVALKEVGNREDCQTCQPENTQFVLLADVVSVPEKYKALIKYMLGDIVLVETLDAAISINAKTWFM